MESSEPAQRLGESIKAKNVFLLRNMQCVDFLHFMLIVSAPTVVSRKTSEWVN